MLDAHSSGKLHATAINTIKFMMKMTIAFSTVAISSSNQTNIT
jgi:hypothetical protein